jgi:hypothetical protein
LGAFFALFALFGGFLTVFPVLTDCLLTYPSIIHGGDLLATVSSEEGNFVAFWALFLLFLKSLILIPSLHTFVFLIDMSCSLEPILSLTDGLVICGPGSGKSYVSFGPLFVLQPFFAY